MTTNQKISFLENRLQVLNNFLLSDEDSLAVFLKNMGVTRTDFVTGLPVILQDVPTNREDVQQYTENMNKMYFDLHKKYANLNADADEACCDGCSMSADGQGAAKVNCNLKYPPPRISKKRQQSYAKCVKEEAARIAAKRDEKKTNPKERKGLHKLNQFNPVFVLLRNSFLSLLKINVAALASALYHIKKENGLGWKRLKNRWYNFGGDISALSNQIEIGRKKKPFPPIKKKKSNADGEETKDELNPDDPKNASKVAIAAAGSLGGLTAILASNPGTVGAVPYVASAGAMLAVVSPILKDFAKSKGEDVSGITDPALPPGTSSEVIDAINSSEQAPSSGGGAGDKNFFEQYKTPIIIAMGTAVFVSLLVAFIPTAKK